jgi:hypothetical protein
MGAGSVDATGLHVTDIDSAQGSLLIVLMDSKARSAMTNEVVWVRNSLV